jgi:hypothetical protein
MQDVPLPFELPPPDPTPSRVARVPVDETPPTPRQQTDLPLPLSGNSGSSRRLADAAEARTLAELLDLLDRLIKIPAAPPLDDVDWRTVRRWLEEAADGLTIRREGLKLIRDAERVLAEEWRTARQIANAKERIEQRKALAEERVAGTHWKRRDAGRRAKQPTHVDVDPAAWRRAKALATKNGMTIGHYVGLLVQDAVEHGLAEVDANATTAHLFARVDVDKATWDEFRALCQERGVNVARGVGVVVSAPARKLGPTSPAASGPSAI